MSGVDTGMAQEDCGHCHPAEDRLEALVDKTYDEYFGECLANKTSFSNRGFGRAVAQRVRRDTERRALEWGRYQCELRPDAHGNHIENVFRARLRELEQS